MLLVHLFLVPLVSGALESKSNGYTRDTRDVLYSGTAIPIYAGTAFACGGKCLLTETCYHYDYDISKVR